MTNRLDRVPFEVDITNLLKIYSVKRRISTTTRSTVVLFDHACHPQKMSSIRNKIWVFFRSTTSRSVTCSTPVSVYVVLVCIHIKSELISAIKIFFTKNRVIFNCNIATIFSKVEESNHTYTKSVFSPSERIVIG